MANVTAGAAYKELTKVGDYITPQINAATDRRAKHNMQQKQINADAQARKEARDDAWAKDTQVDMTNFETIATGNARTDDMYRNAANLGVGKAQELFRQARQLNATDPKGAEALKAKGQAIQLSFKNLASETAVIKPMIDGYSKDYADGKIKEGAYRSFINGLSRNEAMLYLDDNNDWRARVMVRDETSGEIKRGENDEPEYIDKSLSEVRKGIDKPYYFNEVHGKDGELNKVLTAMGKNKYDEVRGDYIDTKQEFGAEQEKSLNDFIKGTLGNDREMYKWFNYATGEEKMKNFTPADKEKITSYINNAVRGAYGVESKISVAGQTQSQRVAAEKLKAGATLEQNKISNALNERKVVLDEYKAANPEKFTKLTEKEKTKVENKGMVIKFYDVAKKIGELGAGANDEAVQKVFDESGLGVETTTDWQWFFQDNEFDIGYTTDIKNKDTFRIVKGMAKQAGIKMEDTDIKEALKEISNNLPTQDTPVKKTPEEIAAEAQALIDKYKPKK